MWCPGAAGWLCSDPGVSEKLAAALKRRQEVRDRLHAMQWLARNFMILLLPVGVLLAAAAYFTRT